MYWKALSMRPPLQPALPLLVSQSTSCCSDSAVRLLVRMALIPSTAAIVEKAQQLPHWPWSFTAPTAPFCRQSTEAGTSRAPAYMKPVRLSPRNMRWCETREPA
uniref:Uncharacterized protein n=1 Tax=Oryza brachyantha TaxID=4533 RepID=J3MV84_ORYBR